jgi:chromate transporter
MYDKKSVPLVSLWNMSKKAVTSWSGFFLGLAAAVILLSVGGFYTTLMIIVGAGFAGLVFIPVSGLGNDFLARIFVTFSGMSLMLFGGGFVFIPLIQQIVVDGLHWVSLPEFTSAIAMGQVTPGPILISAAAVVIGRGYEYHWATPVIFFAALAALMRFKVDIAYIIPCAGLIGMLLY